MRWFRRALIVLALSALAVSGTSAGVLAAGNPDRQPAPVPGSLEDVFCGADLGLITVSIDLDTFRAYVKFFTFADGTQKLEFNGHQTAIVQGNGKTLTFDASGPGTITIRPDGSVAAVGEGHLFYIGPPGSAQPGLFLYSGLTVLDISQPIATVARSSGHVTDICALLAA